MITSRNPQSNLGSMEIKNNMENTMKNTYYITKSNLIHWLYKMGSDQEQESMIKSLGHAVIECLEDGEQFEFGYQDHLNEVIELFPVHLIEDFPNPNLWDIGDELQYIEWLDWDNTEFLIK